MSSINPKDFVRYQLNPPPSKLDLQEYIEKYFQTKDRKYIAWFLHCFEPTLNYRAKKLRAKYSMDEHFADIKQCYIVGIYKALGSYDPKYNVPFEKYLSQFAEREVHNYIRTMRTGYSVQSENEYARLRKAMAILSSLDGKPTDENIGKVAEELNISFEKANEIIKGGIRNQGYTDIYGKDNEEAENTAVFTDSTADPQNLYLQSEKYEKLYEAFDSLEYTEQIMLAQHFGFCPECFSTVYADKSDLNEHGRPKKKRIKPLPYTDIATSHGFSDADTAKKTIEGALRKLKRKI